MFTHFGALLDQLVAHAPEALRANATSLIWLGITLYALRSFHRWGSFR